jgi:hypothetical protein
LCPTLIDPRRLRFALGHLGRSNEAQTVWRELKEINPKYSFEEHVRRPPPEPPMWSG